MMKTFEFVFLLLMIAVGAIALCTFAYNVIRGLTSGVAPRRCKHWVPLSYIYLWPDDGTDPPHVQCKLPAGHKPRDQHLIDGNEVCDLRLFKAPF